MPPKRRALPEESGDASPSPPRRRRLNGDNERSASLSSDDSSQDLETQTQSTPHQSLIKKMVRYALSCEYARQPIRRSDISTKVLGETGSRQFKVVFEGAQEELETKFGMRMIELPMREKTNLSQRRAAQSQVKGPSASTKSYILTSTLPSTYKTAFLPATKDEDDSLSSLLPPARAPNSAIESTYTALYTMVIALILLSPTQAIPEAKLDRYLRRMNADVYMMEGTGGKKEDVLKRMEREGYLERRREVVGGEEGVDYVVGGRGKLEVGIEGVKGLVKSVYGFGSTVRDEEDEEDEAEAERRTEKEQDLERKLARSLGLNERVGVKNARHAEESDIVDAQTQSRTQHEANARPGPRSRGRQRRDPGEDDDDY